MSSYDVFLKNLAPHGVVASTLAISRRKLQRLGIIEQKFIANTGDVDWSMYAEINVNEGIREISFFLQCSNSKPDSDLRIWFRFYVVNHLVTSKSVNWDGGFVDYKPPDLCFGQCRLVPLDDILNAELGFLNNDRLEVDVEFRVLEVQGLHIPRCFNLTDVTPHTVFVMNQTDQLNVDTRLINFHSPYAADILRSGQIAFHFPADMAPILLYYFIQFILGAEHIDYSNFELVKNVAKLAHKFKLFNMVRRCEDQCLLQQPDFSWLDVAVNCDMRRLFHRSISKWSSKEDGKEVKKTLRAIGVKKMSLDMKNALTKKAFELV
ncbi:unnamed protein product [Caenorhabditis sp. 36 PRJEB53466]|nr:unnamed protein product [Caenorhabditis sp. 36 PRJEB53466]